MNRLDVRGLSAGWSSADTVTGLDLTLAAGQRVAVLGANGSGKSTLLAALAGLLRPRRGQILLDGQRIDRMPAHRIARAGVRLLPQTRRIFASMTVAENLAIVGRTDPSWLARFPALPPDQPAADLSGGQQQLLAIVRVLSTTPRVLLLDEPFAGLSVEATDAVLTALAALPDTAIVLVEQDQHLAERITEKTLRLHAGTLHEAARRGP